jgi:WD40-like Beta Propeller Repeat
MPALLALLYVLGVSVGQAQNRPDADSYLGQTPPGSTPVVFAPGSISRGNIHSRLEISPDGREMFWNTVDMKTFSTRIVSVRQVNGKWSEPQSPSFAKEGDTQGAVFSPDGKRLYFRRNTGAGWVAQYVERTDAGWNAPRGDGFSPSGSSSFTRSGRVYYSAGLTTKVWGTGIFGARYSADGYADVAALDATINVPNAIDYTPYVSPDESFLLFSSNRPLIGDKEALFIHVTFRMSDGAWSTPQRLSDIPARFPSLSPDGKYLFFCGDDGNFYWVDRSLIDRLAATTRQANLP